MYRLTSRFFSLFLFDSQALPSRKLRAYPLLCILLARNLNLLFLRWIFRCWRYENTYLNKKNTWILMGCLPTSPSPSRMAKVRKLMLWSKWKLCVCVNFSTFFNCLFFCYIDRRVALGRPQRQHEQILCAGATWKARIIVTSLSACGGLHSRTHSLTRVQRTHI